MNNLTNKISKVFVIHYNKLTDRKEYLTRFFKTNNITNYEFRDNFQRENLTTETKDKYFNLNLSVMKQMGYTNLNSAQICITIEHIETYRKIVNTCTNNDDWYLILEDDAIFYQNFINNLSSYMNNVPSDAEYLDISDYFTINSVNMWERKEYTRTNCAYLIKMNTCIKLLSTIIPFEQPIDHELNKQFKIHNIKNYWSNIPLVHHGSGSNYNGSYTI